MHVIFSTRWETCPSIILNCLRIPQAEDAKYLGLHAKYLGLQAELEKARFHQAKTT